METLQPVVPVIEQPKLVTWKVGQVVQAQGIDFRIASIGPRGRLILKLVK